MKHKKTMIAIISVIALALVIIGVTYAYWIVTRTQEKQNTISTGCLDIDLTNEKNDIALEDAFPTSDEDGMKLTPYEFTITNKCDSAVDYQVALETIGDESKTVISSAIKVALDDSISLLSAKANMEPTYKDAFAARKLTMGTLQAYSEENEDDSVTYNLRLWIDADAPISEMNKTFESKITVSVGQGIVTPIKEGTLAYDIVSNYGGVDVIKELNTIYSDTISDEKEGCDQALINTHYFGTDYEFDKETGFYKLTGDIVSATIGECRAGQKDDGTPIVCGQYMRENTYMPLEDNRVSGIREITSLYSINNNDYENSGIPHYCYTYKALNSKRDTDFTSYEPGVYKTQDDLGDSYYFRGLVTNNYVEFGKEKGEGIIGEMEYYGCQYYDKEYDPENVIDYEKFYECSSHTLEECEQEAKEYLSQNSNWELSSCSLTYVDNIYGEVEVPIYWRIVRINGDGTIRLAYVGNKIDGILSYINSPLSSQFNNQDDDIKYAGYTFESVDEKGNVIQEDSAIKKTLDNWYTTNLKDYGKYIADGIFCNDRQISADIPQEMKLFKSYERIYTFNPSLKCTQKSDRYTISSSIGNGLLNKPIGTLSADEIMFTGGDSNLTSLEYSYLGNVYTMSLSTGSHDGTSPRMIFRDYNGSLDLYYSDYTTKTTMTVMPVINLKADVTFTGDGSFETPYEIVMN